VSLDSGRPPVGAAVLEISGLNLVIDLDSGSVDVAAGVPWDGIGNIHAPIAGYVVNIIRVAPLRCSPRKGSGTNFR
jgi:hypothetical protein